MIENKFYLICFALVLLGHIVFAIMQWSFWPRLCKRLTGLEGTEIDKTKFLGRSFASYNAAIAIGLLLSLRLDVDVQAKVQLVTLGLIAITALVGNAGARGNTILFLRFLPAAAGCLILAYHLFLN